MYFYTFLQSCNILADILPCKSEAFVFSFDLLVCFSWSHRFFASFRTAYCCQNDLSIARRMVHCTIPCCDFHDWNSALLFASGASTVLLIMPRTCFCSKPISISKHQLLENIPSELLIRHRCCFRYLGTHTQIESIFIPLSLYQWDCNVSRVPQTRQVPSLIICCSLPAGLILSVELDLLTIFLSPIDTYTRARMHVALLGLLQKQPMWWPHSCPFPQYSPEVNRCSWYSRIWVCRGYVSSWSTNIVTVNFSFEHLSGLWLQNIFTIIFAVNRGGKDTKYRERMVRYKDNLGVLILIQALVNGKIANKWVMNVHSHSDFAYC